MRNLLASEFIRLFKRRIFWICNSFMFLFAAYLLGIRWDEMRRYPEIASTTPDEILVVGAFYISVAVAVLIGSFIGADYKNGTIRNKLTIGHSRAAIYFSNLVVCTAASLIMYIVWLTAIIVGGLFLLGDFGRPVGSVATLILISFFTVAVYAAIFLLVCMLITSKSAGSVAVLLLSLALLISGSRIYYGLKEPEYTMAVEYTVTNKDGSVVEVHEDSMKNPFYIAGTKRKVYEFLNDLLPSSQVFQLDSGEAPDGAKLPLYSLSLIVVTTAAGVLVFRRKDLK